MRARNEVLIMFGGCQVAVETIILKARSRSRRRLTRGELREGPGNRLPRGVAVAFGLFLSSTLMHGKRLPSSGLTVAGGFATQEHDHMPPTTASLERCGLSGCDGWDACLTAAYALFLPLQMKLSAADLINT